jgi:predicted aspartyl protease
MKTAWAFAALTLLASSAWAADSCPPLQIVAQADIVSTDGSLLVPAKVNGLSTYMIIDTGGWYRQLSPTLVDKLKLSTTKRRVGSIDITGRVTNTSTTVDDFEMGSFRAKNATFLVPKTGFGSEDVGGVIGPQLFTSFDLDLDFEAKKISFILQDHCEGRVIYWQTPSYAIVPFVLTDEGHIRLPVELDGHKFTALLDTGADQSTITFRAAEGAFDITKDSRGVTKRGYLNDEKSVQEYERTFKTLTIAGITFNNPKLSLIPDLLRNHQINDHRPKINSHIDTSTEPEGVDDVILGLEQLRHLHVYIAYKEQKLYISPISPTVHQAGAISTLDKPAAP